MIKILLAEDDKFFLALYKNKLTSAGYEVVVAEDGEVAIKMIGSEKIDVVILDLVMPKKDGFEVLSFMKNNEEYKNIPVIIFSSLSQEEDIQKAKDFGINDYFDKSAVDFGKLKEKIEELTG